MVTRKSSLPNERAFWRKAFTSAELSMLLKQGARITPAGLAHLSAEYADAATREYRRRYRT